MEEATIIILAEYCHNLVERFTPLVEEIRLNSGAARIIGVFAGFELQPQRIEDGGLFAETHFFARPGGAVSLIRSLSSATLITFINHNATFRDSELFRAAQGASGPKAYVLRNRISLEKFLKSGVDDEPAIRSIVARGRREHTTIHIKALLLYLLSAVIVYPARILRLLIPARRDERKRILFIKLDVLGDMIVALPYLAAMREAFPDAELTVIASGRGAAIVKEQRGLYANGLCDRLIVWDAPWHVNFPRMPGLAAAWQLLRSLPWYWKQHYDLVIQPVNFGTGIIFAVLTLGRRVVAVVDSRLPLALRVLPLVSDPIAVSQDRIHHLADFTRMVAAHLGVLVDPAAPGLLVSDPARATVERLLREWGYREGRMLFLFNVGAGHPLRVWGAGKFAALAELVGERHDDALIVLTGSPAERVIALEIERLSGYPITNGAGLLSLNELIALTSLADLMVSVDTGIMHLAAALHTPLVAIFGAGLVDYCKPLSANHIIVKTELGCSGCADRCFVTKYPPCLELVTVPQVHEALENLLAAQNTSRRI